MSEEQARILGKSLWNIANKLRGAMDPDQFRDYMLGFIFFKYLSEHYVKNSKDILQGEKKKNGEVKTAKEIYEEGNSELIAVYEREMISVIGYILSLECLWDTIVEKAKNGLDIIESLNKVFREIESSTKGKESENDFDGLFSDLDLFSSKLGKTPKERDQLLRNIICDLNKDLGQHKIQEDELGDAYEYLIGQFASSAGKKAGEFYTPKPVSTILAKIVTMDSQTGAKKTHLKNVYDPTCGSASLLLNVYHEIGKHVGKLCGQEKNLTTYNLSRMNMLLHNIKYNDFDIYRGDTLSDSKAREGEKFDAIVANPPFSLKWEPSKINAEGNVRFREYALPPQNTADFAFILHMIYHLADTGTLAVVVPHGVLFRGGAEGLIRKNILTKINGGMIDAVIGLPSNMFYSTGIPVCILVIKKCRKPNDVFFIDASKDYEKEKKQNVLKEEHINKIVETYKKRKEIDKYSRKVKLEEIEKNDYNLNIARYIDSSKEEELIDIKEIVKNINDINKEIAKSHKKLSAYAKQLNIGIWDN